MELLTNFPVYIQLIVYLTIIVLLSYEYWITRSQSIIFLILSISGFVVSVLLTIYRPERGTASSSEIILGLETILFSTLYALFFLVLFIDSFNNISILTPRNMLIMLVVAIVETAVFLSYTASYEILQFSNDAVLTPTEELLFLYLVSSTLAAFVMVVILILYIFILLRKKIKGTENPYIKQQLIQISRGGLIIIFGPFSLIVLYSLFSGENPSPELIRLFNSLSVVLGIFLIGRAIHQGGLFILQGDSLKKLLVISDIGVPLYAYSFSSFSKDQRLSDVEGEVLFSGAFKSISMLLSEFTGSSHRVKKIDLEELVLTVRNVGNDITVLLVSSVASRFTEKAMDFFANKVKSSFDHLKDGQLLDKIQMKHLDQLVERSFGFNGGDIKKSQN